MLILIWRSMPLHQSLFVLVHDDYYLYGSLWKKKRKCGSQKAQHTVGDMITFLYSSPARTTVRVMKVKAKAASYLETNIFFVSQNESSI